MCFHGINNQEIASFSQTAPLTLLSYVTLPSEHPTYLHLKYIMFNLLIRDNNIVNKNGLGILRKKIYILVNRRQCIHVSGYTQSEGKDQQYEFRNDKVQRMKQVNQKRPYLHKH